MKESYSYSQWTHEARKPAFYRRIRATIEETECFLQRFKKHTAEGLISGEVSTSDIHRNNSVAMRLAWHISSHFQLHLYSMVMVTLSKMRYPESFSTGTRCTPDLRTIQESSDLGASKPLIAVSPVCCCLFTLVTRRASLSSLKRQLIGSGKRLKEYA